MSKTIAELFLCKQLFFYLYPQSSSIKKENLVTMNKIKEGLSIVICCHNSEKRIPEVLRHLKNQEFSSATDWEILIINNASTDNTEAVALAEWEGEKTPLRVIDEPNPGLSHARIKGFEEARYSIISLIDDDNRVENHWVEKVYRFMQDHPDYGILGSRGKAEFESDPPAWFSDFQRSYAVGAQAAQSGEYHASLYGAGLSIRKEVWEHLKSHNFEFILSDRKGESLTSGGDAELCYATLLTKYKLWYMDDLRFSHFMTTGRLNWPYLARLNKSFALSNIVARIYLAFYSKDHSRQRFRNRNSALLYSVADVLIFLIKKGPGGTSLKREGSKKAMEYAYLKQLAIEHFKLYRSYPKLVAKIENAMWRESKF